MKWRTLEWWGCGVALFIQTGAVFPLLLIVLRGGLDGTAESMLRTMALPSYGITLALLARHRSQVLLAARRNLPFLIMMALPFASILWSIYPAVSLRRAVALDLSMALAFLLAIRFTPQQIMRLIAAVLVPCMVASLALAVVSPGMAFMTNGEMRGVYTSKNVLGWYAVMAFLASIAVTMSAPRTRRWRGYAMQAACGAALLLSASMTSFVALISALCLLPVYHMLGRLHGAARLFFIVAGLQIACLLVVGIGELTVPALEALGRDATLTGRVPLWELVDAAIASHAVLGYGYNAFWTEGNSTLWTIWGQLGWAPPHAHNGYRDLLLSFGLVGLVPFVFMIARALFQGGALHCAAPHAGWIWPNALFGMFLVMNLAESLILEQNSFLFIVFATCVLMFGMRQRAPALPTSRWTAMPEPADAVPAPPVRAMRPA